MANSTTTELPWGLKAYNAIVAALYQLENAALPEADRKRRTIEILRSIDAPTPDDCGVKQQ